MKKKTAQRKHYKDEAAIKAFGEKVREARLAKGMTIEELSNALITDDFELHPTQIGRIERGETNVSISYIVLLAKVLNVKPSELLDFE